MKLLKVTVIVIWGYIHKTELVPNVCRGQQTRKSSSLMLTEWLSGKWKWSWEESWGFRLHDISRIQPGFKISLKKHLKVFVFLKFLKESRRFSLKALSFHRQVMINQRCQNTIIGIRRVWYLTHKSNDWETLTALYPLNQLTARVDTDMTTNPLLNMDDIKLDMSWMSEIMTHWSNSPGSKART